MMQVAMVVVMVMVVVEGEDELCGGKRLIDAPLLLLLLLLLLQNHAKGPLLDILRSNFTTTNGTEVMASHISLVSTAKHFFK